MPSINDVSIALNSLFLDIQNPITLGLNKAEFFKTFREVSFRFSETDFFEFNVNPIFRFDTPEELLKFLEKERQLAENYSDYTNCEYINGLIHEKNCVVTLDVFFSYNFV